MLIRLDDGTEVAVEAVRDEVCVKVCPPGSPWGAAARLDISSCEQLMRGLAMKLREAQD